MFYRIGLDIGVASVGWSIFECDKYGEPYRIVDLGVRIFEAAETPKEGNSPALARRVARGARRRLRRRAHRLERIRYLLEKTFDAQTVELSYNNIYDIYELRNRGINERLRQDELARVLLYFAKHRGYESNRKSERKNKDNAVVLTAIEKNNEYLSGKNYKTIGEMLYNDNLYFDFVGDKKVYKTRNKKDTYDHCFARADLKHEIEMILNKQIECGLIDNAFKEKYVEIFSSHRSFDEGPAFPSPYRMENYKVAKCTFELGEDVAPKASYTFEYFSALQKINNIRYFYNGVEHCISLEQKQKLYSLAREKKEFNYAQVKKLLEIPEDATFTAVSYSTKKGGKTDVPEKTPADIEKKTNLFSMKNSYTIKNALNDEHKQNIELLDELANIISHCKSDDKRLNRIAESQIANILTEEEKENILELDFSTFGNVSIVAMKKIIPYLEEGYKYNEACEKAGYDFKKQIMGNKLPLLKSKEITGLINDIQSPIVRRSVSQTVKVINAIIVKYGSPMAINIELAREMSKTRQERDSIAKQNELFKAEKQTIASEISNTYGVLSPKGGDILKLRLFKEQNETCMYSGKQILGSRLFEDNYVQIDHIIPYSRSFDDSLKNKVLVLASENQDKKDRTPYEYFGGDEKRWAEFENRVKTIYTGNRYLKKRQNLLRTSFSEDIEKAWKTNALNDTRYASKLIMNMVDDYLYFTPITGKKKHVQALNGSITAYCRNIWGLVKVREDGDKHHALDASIIACVTDGITQKITKYNKLLEYKARFEQKKKYSGLDEAKITITDEEIGKYGYIKEPYAAFREELELRLSDNIYETKNIDRNRLILESIGYEEDDIENLKPVFVSRMPKRKANGEIHEAGISSAREKEHDVVVFKKDIKKLKLTKDETAIEDYYEKAKRDDRLLYEALFNKLKEHKGDAKEAFKEPFYKPKKDGTQGNEVKKVLIQARQNIGADVVLERGIASNGSIVRVDIFEKNNKYYTVPVYIKDIYSKHLPNKAITAGKSYENWTEVDNSFTFLFSLFYNDLVYIENKKSMKLKQTNGGSGEKIVNEGYFYYRTINRSTGSASFINNDNSYSLDSCLTTLTTLKKYTVDILGNYVEVKNEKRLNTEWDS